MTDIKLGLAGVVIKQSTLVELIKMAGSDDDATIIKLVGKIVDFAIENKLVAAR